MVDGWIILCDLEVRKGLLLHKALCHVTFLGFVNDEALLEVSVPLHAKLRAVVQKEGVGSGTGAGAKTAR